MTVHIEYVAQMKVAAGTNAQDLVLKQGATAQDAIMALAEQHGDDLATLLLGSQGALRDSTLVFVDEAQLAWDRPQPLKDGDRLTVLAPLAGG